MTDNTDVKTQDLLITRILDAPLELVWQAWTDCEQVKRWWGPKDYISPKCSLDLRVGGKFLFAMRAPVEQGGLDSYTAGVYQKIVPPQLLEFSQYLADKDGNRLDPAEIGMPADFPKEMRTVVGFKAKGEMTELTIRVSGWTEGQMYVYALAGWHQSIDKLAVALSNS
jgi:uncharacterized protein YndB with AHSA1/START domain